MSIVNKSGIEKTTIKISPATIKKLVADDLGEPLDSISIDFDIQEVGGDPMDRYPGTPTVVGIDIVIIKKK